MEKTCLNCETRFNATHKTAKFCSRRCYYLYEKKVVAGINSPEPEPGDDEDDGKTADELQAELEDLYQREFSPIPRPVKPPTPRNALNPESVAAWATYRVANGEWWNLYSRWEWHIRNRDYPLPKVYRNARSQDDG